jgi:hypothetical protein
MIATDIILCECGEIYHYRGAEADPWCPTCGRYGYDTVLDQRLRDMPHCQPADWRTRLREVLRWLRRV